MRLCSYLVGCLSGLSCMGLLLVPFVELVSVAGGVLTRD